MRRLALVLGCCAAACARPPSAPTPGRDEPAAVAVDSVDAGGIDAASNAEAPKRAFCRMLPCVEQLVVRRILERDERFGRFLCKAKMEASIATGGQLVACKLAASITVDGLLLAAGTFIKIDPEGHVADMTLTTPRDFTVAPGSEVRCGKGDISFERQRVRDCVLGAPLKRNGVRCRVGESVSFHANGALASATVDDPVVTSEITFPAGVSVDWAADGHVRGGTLSAPVEARGLQIAYSVELHPNGGLARIHLRREATIQGLRFPAFAEITLRADGTLATAEYTEASGTMIHGEPWTDTRTMAFDARGRVTSSNLEHFQSTARPPR